MNYRSPQRLWGFPLVHINTDGGQAASTGEPHRMVKGWIAIGPVAFGLIAIGDIAVGGIAMGGTALGGLALGGLALGLLGVGGVALGLYALGGLAIGIFAVGGAAFSLQGAVGGLAIARQYAIGGEAIAAHANDTIAQQWMASHPFFAIVNPVMPHMQIFRWLWLLWLPMGGIWLWQHYRRKRDR